MNRRNFFRNTTLGALGTTLLAPFDSLKATEHALSFKTKKAKNIIMLVSDGMSTGTLNMADLHQHRHTGNSSNWMQLYKDNKVTRALMDTASASSIVTDSAAAASSWGGGVRVPNGSLNVSKNGEAHLPLWQKFKQVGKKAGLVTTVPATHATPAGFCVNSKSRNAMDEIAEMYLEQQFDVVMGGAQTNFSAEGRKDNKDLFRAYENAGYQVFKNRGEMLLAKHGKPILGVFGSGALPYSIDRENDETLKSESPSLSEMTQTAIDAMKDHKQGFTLLVEGGKVDWAAHGNDIAGLIYDQIAFDEAIKTAMDFAEKDKETLVIITTDHGNANPGVIYGKDANTNFDSIQSYKHSNEWILNGFNPDTSLSQIKERINYANGIGITDEEAQTIIQYYDDLVAEDGVYNPRHLPFAILAEIQKHYNSVGWISMQHSADYVELAMYGPGSDQLKPFIKNTDLHYLMLKAAEVENNF
ncbi:alkaline phosphatase [Leeuwenhoekiella aestuarii]|uniref:Alkaline phosphatase n=1 Tax=Leeuwenhoekiella aestuarii TaxID=2249426 RepID=A0A4Q0NNS6_9FLAO|nr:alkaline phosphatase [Leeuwenhoekiella aestuarii]RXG11216.1 alkaline phosphatase [Leeuwenhoekiella aestuarii]RXG11582.1 alkaline phosphatase [Leeuwenhoekiella aestuarii]